MKAEFEQMKNIALIENTVTIKTTVKDEDVKALETLADEVLN